jgi:phosphatidylglycerophosphatase A
MLGKSLRLLATGFGSGHFPIAPGTAGTLAVIPIHALLAWWLSPGALLLVAVAFVPLAIAAAAREAAATGVKDPSIVVVDEWAGYLITVAAHPFSWITVVAGFVLFRILDVVKPYPARRLEDLPGGYGIVLDDVAAGIYGALLLWGLRLTIFPGQP